MKGIRNLINDKLDLTAKSSIKNAMIRPVGMLLGLIYTPILLDYLGNEANGVWATVLSIITWINYCDLGIGNGLRNQLAKEIAKNDYEEGRKTISTAYAILSIIAIILLILVLGISQLVNWNNLLNTTLEVDSMMDITIFFVILNFVLALSNSILYALQLSERVSIRSCLVQIINITVLLILKQFENGNLIHMAILFGSSTALIYLFNTFSIFIKEKRLIPRLSLFNKNKIRNICSFGAQFFVIQLTAVLIFSSHNFIASYFFGAEQVTPMTIVNNVYAAGYSVLAALVVPMWSRTTEAIARGEYSWIRKSLKNVRRVSYVFILGYILVAFVFKDLARIWLGKELEYQPYVIAATCIFYIVQTINLIFTQFLYGIGKVKGHMYITILQSVLIVPLSYLLSITFEIGIAGVKLAAALVLVITAISSPIMVYKYLKDLENKERSEVHICPMGIE